jgi:hypothetical protein
MTPTETPTNETAQYSVNWLINVVRLGKTGKRSISLGFCEKTKRVAFITVHRGEDKPITLETLKPLLIHDVYANNTCDDAQWCWDLQCSLNKADPKKLRKYGMRTKQDIEKMTKRLQEIGSQLVSDINWTKKGTRTIYEKAPFIITLK